MDFIFIVVVSFVFVVVFVLFVKRNIFLLSMGGKSRDVGAEKERIHATDESIERGHSLA